MSRVAVDDPGWGAGASTVVRLDCGWLIRDCDPGEGERLGFHRPELDAAARSGWIPVEVPGNVHAALVKAGRIGHPYDGLNSQTDRWVEQREWWYRLEFTAGRPLGVEAAAGTRAGAGAATADTTVAPERERVFLTFLGMDTLATVWLNGELLGGHRNMFVPVEIEVTGRLRADGPNTLAVRFDPAGPLADSLPALEGRCPFHKGRVWLRKAQMCFLWDWCPRLVTTGLWRGVRLARFTGARLGPVFAKTLSVAADLATLEVEVPYESWSDEPLLVEATLAGQTRSVRARHGLARLRFNIQSPRFWWTHDLGEPHLYELDVRLLAGRASGPLVREGGDMGEGEGEVKARVLDSTTVPVGIRTIQVLMEPDSLRARGFTFVLNGVRLFAKGANWVPADGMFGTVGAERYRKLVGLARDSHMNMLRVWGGGIYEDPEFYETCDRLGILVWQDFMFACGPYPDHDAAFMGEVEREARAVVQGLRNHPCISIWCGNNENDAALELDEHFYGYRIYHHLLPGVCASLDPTRPYWPSSPWGGHTSESEFEGDRHDWDVWHGGVTPRLEDFRRYADDRSRFVSEFGIQSSPPLSTLRRHIPAEELYYDSPQFVYRIKDVDPYHKRAATLESYAGPVATLEDYEVLSMLVQAEGLKFGIEHWRRRKFHCSGALVWQLNDSWPGVSHSLVDYYLHPKAAYYYVRRAFAPLLLCFREEPRGLSVWGLNDTLSGWAGRVEAGLATFTGEELFRRTYEVAIPANAASKLFELTWEVEGQDRADLFAYVRALDMRPRAVQGNHHLFRRHKDTVFPAANVRARVEDGAVVVTTDNFARFVHFQPVEGVWFDDNYFDLYPGETRRVTYVTCGGRRLSSSDLVLTHLSRGRAAGPSA